ncbi:MAG: hypothetical protein ABIP35_07240 [Ginsengibacter sp.]
MPKYTYGTLILKTQSSKINTFRARFKKVRKSGVAMLIELLPWNSKLIS